ncbi:histidine--tRNA ligase [Desulfobulbus alkaliphilus]|uniref:histidine--tRNA ligase n=1 Tax=Desulfobulbus alkaliphilus TaxID=869814 RepID=UPI00196461D5|nr:histidine--tRNA ligase [Desulfobulbus alkaliphilus]MBM9536817.1 histidine--tRNA ligase [Desulfobulbus alkaliphilus]
MKIQAINGFKDILPDNAGLWRRVEQLARNIFDRFGLREIRMPILEKTELFTRSIGAATDVVEKEMYTFADKGITMRPEATASIMRAFIEHGLHVRQPVQRLYTIGPMFRHERPQKGRLRQFHQLNAEVIGAAEPHVDAELIAMGRMLLDELDLQASLELNSLGCPACRPPFKTDLIHYLEQRLEGLCSDCQRRTHTNPMRVLDCKKTSCRQLVLEAPSMLTALCADCDEHFQAVQGALRNLDITFRLNPFMVRGLDYYTRTTFEFLTTDLGAQAAVGAGGRYDGLIEQLGGPSLGGIGFAMGLERLVLLLEQRDHSEHLGADTTDFALVSLGTTIDAVSLLAHHLRRQGCRAAIDYSGRSLKAQLKQADRARARFALIIGDDEWTRGEAVLRNMRTQQQQPFPLSGSPEQQSQRLAELLRSQPD